MDKFGIKEVADVVFYDVETKKPVIVFETLKVSTIENQSETAEARGGQGNASLLNWNFGRTATLAMQDALLSMESMAMLAGTAVVEDDIQIHAREKFTVPVGGSITVAHTPVTGTVSIFKMDGSSLLEEIAIGTPVTLTGSTIAGLTAGTKISVFYQYDAPVGAQLVKFQSDAFPSTYKVVGDTVVRDQATGKDKVAQFIIPKATLQSGFSLTMDVENVSVFDFNLNVLVDGDTKDLYQIIKLP